MAEGSALDLDAVDFGLEEKETSLGPLGPPEGIGPAIVYQLYRGSTCQVSGRSHRIWVEFASLRLCWAPSDLPAEAVGRVSLLDVSSCHLRAECAFIEDTASQDSGDSDPGGLVPEELETGETGCFVEIFASRRPNESFPTSSLSSAHQVSSEIPRVVLAVTGPSDSPLGAFARGLQKLLASRDNEGKRGLEFIQQRLFQYLWRHQGLTMTEEAIYEAQAVLSFNLEPKEGIKYLKNKLGKKSDTEIGEWLARMATIKGGLDPTMLGNYFSRKDTMEVFKIFVRLLDFRHIDVVEALRKLFDTFKPGGEGQVITRILELFAEAYFLQWQTCKDTLPKAFYANADSIEKVAVSLIMLNTGLHVASKKVKRKNHGKTGVEMTVEEYIRNTRQVVGPEEVPDESLRSWYAAVKKVEISVFPLPRVAFSQLPVQPDIEGWLVLVQSAQVQRRYWAVLALRRLYLFSDTSDCEPTEAIDLKDMSVHVGTTDNVSFPNSGGNMKHCLCLFPRSALRDSDADSDSAFELRLNLSRPAQQLSRILQKQRTRLLLVAESADLMDKWVHLIS